MYERHIKKRIVESLNEFRVVYVPGARQAGKSTLIRQISEETGRQYITLDEQVFRDSAGSDPEGFIDAYKGDDISIDEVQYIPDLVLAVKQVSDLLPQQQKGKFLLTGSTDLFAGKEVTDRLPGHMDTLTMYPLSLAELEGKTHNIIDRLVNSDFVKKAKVAVSKQDLCEKILNGGYPEVQSKSNRAKTSWFRSYLQARVLKDFEHVYRGRGAYIDHANALLNLLSGRCGNLLSYNNLSNELGIGDEKTKNMIVALEQMFIVRRAAGYIKNRSKRLAVTTPKIHFIDTGLACYLLGIRTQQQLLASQFFGGLLENLLYIDLCKNAVVSDHEVEIYHFRDHQQKEVDIVLEEPGGMITGVEIKAAKSFSKADFSGLTSLASYAGSKFKQGILLYTGEKILPMKIEGQTFTAIPFSSLYG
ncbi:MAG: putative AAA+ superfamily ATPase [Gammaproteobacteria bacterium]|jgi:predicted AAA+ superfamily ATPase